MSDEHRAEVGDIRHFGDRSMVWTTSGWQDITKDAMGQHAARGDVRLLRVIICVAASIPVIALVVLWTLLYSGWLIRIGAIAGIVAIALLVVPHVTFRGYSSKCASCHVHLSGILVAEPICQSCHQVQPWSQ